MSYQPIAVRSMRNGGGVYIDRSPDSPAVARSTHPHESVTFDFDANGRLIGVEILAVPFYTATEVAAAEAETPDETGLED